MGKYEDYEFIDESKKRATEMAAKANQGRTAPALSHDHMLDYLHQAAIEMKGSLVIRGMMNGVWWVQFTNGEKTVRLGAAAYFREAILDAYSNVLDGGIPST